MKKTIVRIGCVMLAAALIAGCIIAYAETTDKPSDTVKVVQTAEPEVETDNLTERNDEYRIPTIVRDYINVTNAENGCLAAPANYQVDCWDTPIDLRADMTVLMIKGHITGNFEVYAARDNGVETVWPLVVAEVMVDEVLSVPAVEAPVSEDSEEIAEKAGQVEAGSVIRIALASFDVCFNIVNDRLVPSFNNEIRDMFANKNGLFLMLGNSGCVSSEGDEIAEFIIYPDGISFFKLDADGGLDIPDDSKELLRRYYGHDMLQIEDFITAIRTIRSLHE